MLAAEVWGAHGVGARAPLTCEGEAGVGGGTILLASCCRSGVDDGGCCVSCSIGAAGPLEIRCPCCDDNGAVLIGCGCGLAVSPDAAGGHPGRFGTGPGVAASILVMRSWNIPVI